MFVYVHYLTRVLFCVCLKLIASNKFGLQQEKKKYRGKQNTAAEKKEILVG